MQTKDNWLWCRTLNSNMVENLQLWSILNNNIFANNNVILFDFIGCGLLNDLVDSHRCFGPRSIHLW